MCVVLLTYVMNPRAPFYIRLAEVNFRKGLNESNSNSMENWFRNAPHLIGCDFYQFQLRVVGKQEGAATFETV